MAISPSPRLQSWLELRGIACSSDPEFAKVVPWMRTTFVLCGSLIGIGTAFAYTPLLWLMVPIAAAGTMFRVHPFDLIYNYGNAAAAAKWGAHTLLLRCGCGLDRRDRAGVPVGRRAARIRAGWFTHGCRRPRNHHPLLHPFIHLSVLRW